jgi:hypothetical protein
VSIDGACAAGGSAAAAPAHRRARHQVENALVDDDLPALGRERRDDIADRGHVELAGGAAADDVHLVLAAR